MFNINIYHSVVSAVLQWTNIGTNLFVNNGKWANAGGCQPNALYNSRCLVVDICHS